MARKRIQSVTFTVTADKIRGQGRPRFTTKRGIPKAYKSNKDMAWEQVILDAYKNSPDSKDMADFAGEVHIIVQVNRKLPKRAPKRLMSEPDIHKPDADNIGKSVLDALNRVAFKDDQQVTRLTVEKSPRTRRNEEVMEVTIVYYAEIGTH